MGVGTGILSELKAWIALAIFIVVGSIVLLNFKDVNNVACPNLYTFNETANNCYLTSNSSIKQGISTTGSTIDQFVAGLSEPGNWIVIVVIAIIGIAILFMFSKKLK